MASRSVASYFIVVSSIYPASKETRKRQQGFFRGTTATAVQPYSPKDVVFLTTDIRRAAVFDSFDEADRMAKYCKIECYAILSNLSEPDAI